MPRHRKDRCCRHLDGETLYKPAGIPACGLELTVIELDEFEAMRLCDLEGLTQENAGLRMGVSRGTVQRLLERGRQNLIGAILTSQAISIRNKGDQS